MKISRLLAASVVGVAAVPVVALGHGSMSDPASRIYHCAITTPDAPACAAARAANPQALYDWMEVNIGDAAGRHRALIPDGTLCSAGRSKYAAFDAPAAWPTTHLRPGADGRYTLTWRSTAPHATAYYRVYLTTPAYDRTRALRWDDLELVHDSGALPRETTTTLRVTLPARTGPQVLYTIWQRSDSPEAFYACSDVVMDATAPAPGPGPAPVPVPVPAPVPAPVPVPVPAPVPAPGTGLTIHSTISTDWGTGFCRDLRVTNGSLLPVRWTVPLEVGGTITSLWNARAAGGATSGTIEVGGESWNRDLMGGQVAAFGYCATRAGTIPAPAPPPVPAPAPPPPPVPEDGAATMTRRITSDWGRGFCADVTVRTAATSPVIWQVQLATGGVITSIWDAVTAGESGTVPVRGAAWNAAVTAAQPVTFGYCVQR